MTALLHDAGSELALTLPDTPSIAAGVTVRTAPISDLPWTGMDLVSFGTQSLNLDAVTQVLIGLVRDVEHQNRTTSLLGTLREQLSALHGQVDAEVDRIYATITVHIVAQLTDTFSHDTNSALAARQAALAMRARSVDGSVPIRNSLATLRESTQRETAFLSGLREKVLSGGYLN